MRLVFLGPPGAGKGTQAYRLTRHFNLLHVATGDMLRRAVESGTTLGLHMKEIMDSGDLVPDELTNQLVGEAISSDEAAKGFILDGYPRNVVQAEALESTLSSTGARLDNVVRFMVKGPEIAARLAGRRVCPVCKSLYHIQTHPPKVKWVCDNEGAELVQRPDDQEETILRRLEVYGQKTRPLFDFYAAIKLLTDMDAMGSEDEVFGRLLTAIK
ncbi:MAG: adenylate kinase [Actinomycetota bacterium]